MRPNDLLQILKTFIFERNTKMPMVRKQLDGKMPDRFVAQVKELKDIYALLKTQSQGDILAKVDTPVKVGEYLLLQLSDIQDGKPHYRVIKRSLKHSKLTEEKNVSFAKVLIKEREEAVPIMIRQVVNRQNEKDGKGKKGEKGTGIFLVDFIMKTRNLGLMIVQLKQIGDFNFIRLLVESNEAGALLEKELKNLHNYFERLKENKIIFLKWGIMPTQLNEEICRSFGKTGFGLDKQV
ncbi:MAG: hypothetical protein GX996_06045 [Firmicutes bacterium]|nr:hypothetical protein [Bacillota bacterium]